MRAQTSTAAIPHRVLIPLIVACGLFMETLDNSAVATALPTIAADFHRDPLDLKFALTAYLLSLAVCIPASGWFADRLGSRNVFCAAMGTFALGSLLCGLSNSVPALVGSRVVQGMGGAMMVPVGRLVILRSVAKSERIGAMAWFTIPALFGPIIGAPLGGFITTFFNWRWIFWINVPIGLFGIAVASWHLPHIRGEVQSRFDLPGFTLTAFGLCALVAGVTSLGMHATPPLLSVGLTVAGIVAFAAYVVLSRAHANPFVDLRLFTIPSFRYAMAGASVFRFGLGAAPFLFPLLLQIGFGMTPLASGMITLTTAVGAIGMKFMVRQVLRYFGFRDLLIRNALLIGVITALPALFTTDTPVAVIVLLLLLLGFLRSLHFTSVNTLIFADVPGERMSRATSLASVAQQVSMSMGISFGALAIDVARHLRGAATLRLSDFSLAFVVVGGLSAASALVFARLSSHAGDDMAGRHGEAPPQAEET